MVAMRVQGEARPAPAKMPKRSPNVAAGVIDYLTKHAARQEVIDGEMMKPLPLEFRTLNALRYWCAFARVKTPSRTPEAYEWLCEAINIGMILCENGIGAEYLPAILAAQDAIYFAWPNAQATGFYAMDEAGIAAVAHALEVHDAQLEVAWASEIALAERTLRKRLNEGNTVTIEPLAA